MAFAAGGQSECGCTIIVHIHSIDTFHQLEDPGKLIQTGYSAGARSKPSFAWVRNILCKRELTPDFIASSDYRTSCLFAIAWNICRSRLPAVVMGDWLEFNQKNQLPRMDGGIGTSATAGEVSLSLGETEILFNGMELAPACGMMGQNYSRCVISSN